MSPPGRFRPDEPEGGGTPDYKGQAPLRDAFGPTQTCRQTPAFVPSRYDPERGPRYRCADGSNAADPRPSARPDRTHSGSRDRKTACMGRAGTPKGNPAAPTAHTH